MSMSRRGFLALAASAAAGLAACAKPGESNKPEDNKVDLNEFKDLELDDSKWMYDDANDCYYQLGLPYCTKPAAGNYEALAIFVPGKYFKGEKNGSTWSCKVNPKGKVGSFTASTAPVVMPVNSARLSSEGCPTAYSYDGLRTYLARGLVYVYAGFRGRSGGYVSDSEEQYSGGAPWPVVDLKAAVRFLRYNRDYLPINPKRIFVFGLGAGGGVAACMGALGDSGVFSPYLSKIGAATHDADGHSISDAVYGSASWCPETSFDAADSGYEWMMGQFATDDTRKEGSWKKLLSDDLAGAYGKYVNKLGLTNDDGDALKLESVQDGSYLAGTYYDHLQKVIEGSAEKFFSTTSFPYTFTPGRLVDTVFPGDPNLDTDSAVAIDTVTGEAVDTTAAAGAAAGGAGTSSSATTGATTGEKDDSSSSDASSSASSDASGSASDSTSATSTGTTSGTGTTSATGTTAAGVSVVQSTVYDTAESYVSALNKDERWITYSPSAGGVSITSLWDFVTHCRSNVRGVCAFDALDRSTIVNQLFGVDDDSSLHFDETLADLLKDNASRYAERSGFDDDLVDDWEKDVAKLDSLNTDMESRVDAMNPLYGLCGHYAGFGSCEVAPYWRVNTGLFQTATSLTTDVNLVLALNAYDGVKSVEFNPVWGRGFELAEVSGDAQTNFAEWVVSCCK
ncbi:MAG: tannase [Olsenella sp.]|nr:tannase [Olsenella sp.]